ncbi:sulfotransferase domain-containing protein [Candidatus Litorirhabdus singularis]|nr:sulfotransferase domain-containing protein [Candidatus Litorirhabdus singularis]
MNEDRIKFVTVSTQRSGSTWLTDLLNSHHDIVSYTELLLLKGEGTPDWGRYKDIVYWKSYQKSLSGAGKMLRPLGIYSYLDRVFSAHPEVKALGLKVMYTQIARMPETLCYMKSRNVHVIHLVRSNLLDIVLSSMVKAARGVAHMREQPKLKQSKIYVEPLALLTQLKKRQREQRLFSMLLRGLGLPYLEVSYENLSLEKKYLGECVQFLGCSYSSLESDMLRINPGSHDELVENIDELISILGKTEFSRMLRV